LDAARLVCEGARQARQSHDGFTITWQGDNRTRDSKQMRKDNSRTPPQKRSAGCPGDRHEECLCGCWLGWWCWGGMGGCGVVAMACNVSPCQRLPRTLGGVQDGGAPGRGALRGLPTQGPHGRCGEGQPSERTGDVTHYTLHGAQGCTRGGGVQGAVARGARSSTWVSCNPKKEALKGPVDASPSVNPSPLFPTPPRRVLRCCKCVVRTAS
jgi:hypothetical protein